MPIVAIRKEFLRQLISGRPIVLKRIRKGIGAKSANREKVKEQRTVIGNLIGEHGKVIDHDFWRGQDVVGKFLWLGIKASSS